MMMPSVAINCWKTIQGSMVLVNYKTHGRVTVPAVCLSFKSQCVDLFFSVDGCAAILRYSFCEAILQVRLYGGTDSKLDRTLKHNYNTNDFPKHLWVLGVVPVKPAWNNASRKTKADIITLNQCQEGCVEKWASLRAMKNNYETGFVHSIYGSGNKTPLLS